VLLAGCEYEDSRAISSKIILRDIISDEQQGGRTITLSFCTKGIMAQPQPIIYDASVVSIDIPRPFGVEVIQNYWPR